MTDVTAQEAVESVAEPKAKSSGARGYLGVGLQESEDGVGIENIVPGSPAEDAKFQAGDVLFDIGGSSIVSIDDLREALAGTSAGDKIAVGLMRGGKPIRVEVKLGDAAALSGASRPDIKTPAPILPDVVDSIQVAQQQDPDKRARARTPVRVELPKEAPSAVKSPEDVPAEPAAKPRPVEWKVEDRQVSQGQDREAKGRDGRDAMEAGDGRATARCSRVRRGCALAQEDRLAAEARGESSPLKLSS